MAYRIEDLIMQTKKIIYDYIANILEREKEISNFDPSYRSINKEHILKDIIKKFNLKHSDAYRHCSYHNF